jgi:hypothetical protein
MTSLISLPARVLEEIYLSLPKSFLQLEMLEALVADEKMRLMQDGSNGKKLDLAIQEYKSRLEKLGPISLAEMAYEACVYTDRFDTETNQAWIDRDGHYRINPNDLYKHHFIDSMFSLAEKAQGETVTRSDRKNLKDQLESICASGTGSLCLGYGDMSLSFSGEKRLVKFNIGASEQTGVTEADVDRLTTSFSKFIDRCKPGMGQTATNSSSMGM